MDSATDELIPADTESERARPVYLAALADAPIDAGELAAMLDVPGPALLSTREELAWRGHGERSGETYTTG